MTLNYYKIPLQHIYYIKRRRYNDFSLKYYPDLFQEIKTILTLKK